MKEQDVKGKRNRRNRKHKIACPMHVNNGNTMDIIDLVVLIKNKQFMGIRKGNLS